MITLTCETYDALSKNTLHDILRLRSSVFVDEQGCVYQDIDGNDMIAHHCLLQEYDLLQGYCRIIPPAIKHDHPAIGRYALLPEARGKGLGRKLFAFAIQHTQSLYPSQPIYIQAQYYLHRFYESFGFKQVSEIYDDVGIPHIDMVMLY